MKLRLLVLVALSACGGPTPGDVDGKRLLKSEIEPGEWISVGRGWKNDWFSPLTQINDRTVSRLGFAWEYEARSHRGRVEHGGEATPVVVDGVLYVSGPWGSVFAVDARTGAERWRYDPEVDGSYHRRACCGVVNRGLAVWQGRVYVATLDGFLVALDAATGLEVWRVDTLMDRDTRSYTITGAPQVAKEVVVIGNSGGEFGVRGYVTGYDLETGAQRWRFFTVPGDPAKGPPENPAMELAARTWGPKTDWNSGLGGTVWGLMSYDPELDLLYVGTGNSTPYSGWYRDPSKGDNLFLVSILALDPDDGQLRWHYQQVPWEIWDYTATSPLVLADLTIEGRARKVIMQAPKNGFFYVLDRETGEFISARPYVFQNWALGHDSAGRPIINPKAIYDKGPAVVFPTMAGSHNWQPMSFNPRTGLVYLGARHQGMIMTNVPEYHWRKGEVNLGAMGWFSDWLSLASPEERAAFERVVKANPELPGTNTQEWLLAWDPVTQQERWRIPVSTAEYAIGGVLSTAGNLVIHGAWNGQIVVYRAGTGEQLKVIETGTGIMAAPMSYEIDGVQYVAVLAGSGSWYQPGAAGYRYQDYGRILAFKLDGGQTPLPSAREAPATPEVPADLVFPDSMANRGTGLFFSYCAGCHVAKGEARLGGHPDLHRLAPATHADFAGIVLGGKLAPMGMASFADVLKPEDARAIHAYLVREQRRLVVSEKQ